LNGHQLILGELTDFITGITLQDTHDERYRQAIARLLIEKKGYAREDIRPRSDLTVKAGAKKAIIQIDFTIVLKKRMVMIIRYGPGSLVTRHRPALAASRVLATYQIPLVVVTNGVEADVLHGKSGTLISRGMGTIPSKERLRNDMQCLEFEEIKALRKEMESRIIYAFEVDGSCACDDTVCRL
jgi:hypothetical protein